MRYVDKLNLMIDGNGYNELLECLDSIEFFSDIPLDENRIKGALNLRAELGGRGQSKPVTVLEVLVAMSYKAANDILCGEEGEDRTAELFWLMMHNLELDHYSDDYWGGYDGKNVDTTIYILLTHRYNPDGTGGSLFPIPGDTRDHRKAQLWEQLNWYLWEEYNYEWS